MAGLERLFYIDDSYREESGLAVFGWIECHPVEWRRALREWLELRKVLRRDFGVQADKELHATEFINGRGRLSDDLRPLSGTEFIDGEGRVRSKELGQAVAIRCLETIGSCQFLRVGSVWRKIPAGPDFTTQKYALYGDFVAKLDAELQSSDVYGLVVMDGEDPHYRTAHRALKLDSRHIIEDAVMHDSATSQWLQMADLVAYTTLMHLNRHSQNAFGWHWHETYLTPRHGEPQEL